MKIMLENEHPPHKPFWLWSVCSEAFALTVIVALGWFLIGDYTRYEFLDTGYQDWLYHAFRVRDISQYGIAAWDHIWGNGINHWRAFQYAPHFLAFYVVKLTGLSIAQAMLWVSAAVFVALRLLMYGALRYLGVNRLFSFFAVIVSYAFSQQWIAFKDYSMYVGFIILPLYVLLWIAALKEVRYVYVLAAVAGASWSLHPVIGYSASGLLFLLALANNLKQDVWRIGLVAAIFLISSLPFTLPYFFAGYSFSNPIFVTPQFLRDTILSEYFGLSLMHYIFMGLSWAIFLWKSNESPRWAKLLLLYCTLYLCFIYFGLLGYYPDFINKFQFSRAIPLIGLLLSFCFAAFLQSAFFYTRSRILYTVFLVLTVAGITQSIEIASRYSGQPVSSIQNPVAIYFADKDIPEGSIYFRNVAEASYFGKPGLRFITSYNQHLLLNPYPMRFDILMKTDIAYTGVSAHQLELINDYATVLGVEYIVLPALSPLADGLTANRGSSEALFAKEGEVTAASEIYAVLRSRQAIAYAYAFEEETARDLLRFSALPKPTLQAASYKPWDEEISRMAALIRNGNLKPLPLSFIWPDKLAVDTATLESFQSPGLLIMQSYDSGWTMDGAGAANIEPTNLRFMRLTFPGGIKTEEVKLRNDWPWWHWPVQTLGVAMIALTAIGAWGLGKRQKHYASSSR